VTLSFGDAQHRRGESLEQFIQRADQGMYRAKNEGRNRVATIGMMSPSPWFRLSRQQPAHRARQKSRHQRSKASRSFRPARGDETACAGESAGKSCSLNASSA